jgi:hypothetical protein
MIFQKNLIKRAIYNRDTAKILPICGFELAFFLIFLPRVGALAQLARAFDWQSRGHRFDSDMLHSEDQRVASCKVCSPFSFNHTYLHVLQTILKNVFHYPYQIYN